MDLKLAGKVVLITSSSRGIGLATAKAFAAEGCRLMLSARSAGPLAEAEAALRASTADVAAHAADVSKPDEAAGLVQAAVAAFGGIDVLIKQRRWWRSAHRRQHGWRLAQRHGPEPDPDRADDAAGAPTYEGPRGCCCHKCGIDFRLVAPACDVWAVRRGKGSADFRYRALALEFVPHCIRVNTVSPGSILVAGSWDRYRLANQEYFDDYVRHGFPMGRLGTA